MLYFLFRKKINRDLGSISNPNLIFAYIITLSYFYVIFLTWLNCQNNWQTLLKSTYIRLLIIFNLLFHYVQVKVVGNLRTPAATYEYYCFQIKRRPFHTRP